MSLTAGDLTLLRAAQALLFPDTASVYRRVDTANTSGGEAWTWPTVTHTYACRLASSGAPQKAIQMAAERQTTPWMVTFAQGGDVLMSDHIVISGRTLEVIGFLSGGAWETALRVVCVEVI